MIIKVTTKNYGIVYTKNLYRDIEHFFDNIIMHEQFFITDNGKMITENEIVIAEEVKEND